MKANEYIELNRLRRILSGYKTELLASRIVLGLCVLITLASVFTLDWACVAAAWLTMVIPTVAMLLIERQIEKMDERVFQFRLKHSKYWI